MFRDPAQTVQPSQPNLVASVIVDGNRLQGQLALSVDTHITLGAWVRGQKSADVTYDLKRQSWELPDVVLFFYDPGAPSLPLKPPFTYGFPTPPFVGTPPVLEVAEFFGHAPDQYTLRLKPKLGANLGPALGSAPNRQGLPVRVTIIAEDDQQHKYTAEVTLRFKRQPMLQFQPAELILRPGQEERLEITLCENRGDGPPQPLADAQISVQASEVPAVTLPEPRRRTESATSGLAL